MEKYFYKVDKLGTPQRCEFNHNKEVVSSECLLCENNEGYDNLEGWVKCHCYSNMIENKLLREKIKTLEEKIKTFRSSYDYSINEQKELMNEIESLKKICNGKK